VNWLMRLSLVMFVVSLSVWGVIAVWRTVRVYELMRTWQIIAVSLAVVSGLVMLARHDVTRDIRRLSRRSTRPPPQD
jgi:hypothetical protein